MKTDDKMSDQDDGDNYFEFPPISPLYWSKNYHSKYSHLNKTY